MRRLLLVIVTAALLAAIASGPTDSAPVLKPFVRGSWTQLRAAHRGKPLVVHFWGITCPPCVGELPKWAGLMRRYPGVDVVFVAGDPVPVEPAHVIQALAKARLDAADHWIFADEFTERLRFQINPDWEGELPFSVLLAPDGTTRTLRGVVDFTELEGWIRVQGGSGAREKKEAR